MRMDGVALSPSRAHGYGLPSQSRQDTAGAGEVREKTESQAGLPEPPLTDEQDQDSRGPAVADSQDGTAPETQKTRGVSRLLQQGHFKGVADLRLRINFAEELAGIELPGPSAPKGNGRAYQKFLGLYTGPQQDDAVGAPDGTDTVDGVA